MHIDKYLEKKMILFILSIFLILLCILITYIVNIYDNINEVIQTDVENLQIIYETDAKTLNYSSVPVTYDEGMATAPSNTIRIVNTGDEKTAYDVYLITETDNIIGLSDSKVYVSINGNSGVLLSSLVDDLLYSSSIKSGAEQIINIKIWLASEYITNDDLNKSLYLKVKIVEK